MTERSEFSKVRLGDIRPTDLPRRASLESGKKFLKNRIPRPGEEVNLDELGVHVFNSRIYGPCVTDGNNRLSLLIDALGEDREGVYKPATNTDEIENSELIKWAERDGVKSFREYQELIRRGVFDDE